tara:strand:+ start:214 stop:519 length:306 start_codon:yes stop_codon:yes gene_type:complete
MPSNAPNKESHLFDIQNLDIIQDILETEIANFAITEVENLHDEENDTILRVFYFERGTKTHFVVLNPSGHIQSYSEKLPTELAVDIMNEMMDYAYITSELI